MNKANQIEEMAKDICQNGGTCSLEEWNDCHLSVGKYCAKCNIVAERLYNAGYRKQSVGEWIFNRGRTYGEPAYYCSVCSEGASEYSHDKYCPNCGAKMRKEDEKNEKN